MVPGLIGAITQLTKMPVEDDASTNVSDDEADGEYMIQTAFPAPFCALYRRSY